MENAFDVKKKNICKCQIFLNVFGNHHYWCINKRKIKFFKVHNWQFVSKLNLFSYPCMHHQKEKKKKNKEMTLSSIF